MPDYPRMENRLREILGLKQRPVAVSFPHQPPARVEKFAGSEPSGCSFWRLAAQGRTFYTEPGDHYNCPVGAHTHRIELAPDRAHDWPDTLGTMTGLGYLKMEEVPGIPVLKETPKFILYAPLSETPVDPDVVLLAAVPGNPMLLEEAAIRAGALETIVSANAALAQYHRGRRDQLATV